MSDVNSDYSSSARTIDWTMMQIDQDPDRSAVEKAQLGHEDALADLLQRYREPIFAFVFRSLGGSVQAEDVAQETFVRAFQNIGSFRFRNSARFSTWLFQLARHAALDELRRQRRRPTLSLDEFVREPATAEANAADQMIHHELGEAIGKAVAALPEDQRTALVLTEYHGQSAQEVARVLGCTVRGAESRLFRARQAAREQLERQGWKQGNLSAGQ